MEQKDKGSPLVTVEPSGEPCNSPLNNQKQAQPQESWKSLAVGTLDKLRKRFPACFVEPQPLKVGIRADIIEAMPELSELDVSRALKFHVTRTGYLQRCIEGSPRLDLNGEAAGVISAAEAANAQRWLAKRRKRRPQPTPTPTPTPASASPPKKLSLDDLRAASRKRAAGP